ERSGRFSHGYSRPERIPAKSSRQTTAVHISLSSQSSIVKEHATKHVSSDKTDKSLTYPEEGRYTSGTRKTMMRRREFKPA
ncbi:hypothetical protein, partial [Aurantimonas aggregata]|uniref:hypothetical protein n=1 Tax=Aurantimonas aggregata TaxID=2047720 RepID=UPI0019435B84